MNYKLFAFAALVAVVATGFAGVGQASAARGLFGMGQNLTPDEIATRQTERFQREAGLLGVSVDVVKQGWAEGKTIADIAQANGITTEQLQAKMKTARETQMKSHLQTLVEKGVITQAQADTHFAARQTRAQNGNGMGRGMGKGRMGGGFGGSF